MTVEEAAKYVGLSVSFMNVKRVRGDGPPYIKLGRRVVYDRADLDLWLESRKRLSTSQ